jgi:hypothetical protein
MTSQVLWQVLCTTSIPEKNLRSLAYDLYESRRPPRPDSRIALEALARKLSIEADYAYEAFNTDPSPFTLKSLADDLRSGRAWPDTSRRTKDYIEKVSRRIDIIQKAEKSTKSTAVAILAAFPAPSSGLSRSAIYSIALLTIGGAVYSLAISNRMSNSLSHQRKEK